MKLSCANASKDVVKQPLPSFRPITHESVRLSEERFHRQLKRNKHEKEIQKKRKKNREKRKEWLEILLDKNELDKEIRVVNDNPSSPTVESPLQNPPTTLPPPASPIDDPMEDMELPKAPNLMLITGKKLIPPLSNKFCSRRYTGIPLEEMDEYYRNRRSFVVISGDKTIFRFSLAPSLFIFGPFNKIRRAAIYAMVHPMVVLTAILVNCVFMALNDSSKLVEIIFTAFYTCEACIKVIACGLIFDEFTYLRDAWNWMDFIVISLAYMMFVIPSLGNLSALRSLRVLRALKTVTTIPGLKTIIGALMDAVMHLRDVAVLTLFILSIFSLIGVQLYRGTLLRKCVTPWPGIDSERVKQSFQNLLTAISHNVSLGSAMDESKEELYSMAQGLELCQSNASTSNSSEAISSNSIYNNSFCGTNGSITQYFMMTMWNSLSNYTQWQVTEYFYDQKENWMAPHIVCRNFTDDGNSTCPIGYICKQTLHGNPNFGYTNFDNFASALLCAFRLITQDFWENLYQLVLRANGPTHIFFFVMVIFVGSFYLLNIILSIVSMSYEQVYQRDIDDDKELAEVIAQYATDEDYTDAVVTTPNAGDYNDAGSEVGNETAEKYDIESGRAPGRNLNAEQQNMDNFLRKPQRRNTIAVMDHRPKNKLGGDYNDVDCKIHRSQSSTSIRTFSWEFARNAETLSKPCPISSSTHPSRIASFDDFPFADDVPRVVFKASKWTTPPLSLRQQKKLCRSKISLIDEETSDFMDQSVETSPSDLKPCHVNSDLKLIGNHKTADTRVCKRSFYSPFDVQRSASIPSTVGGNGYGQFAAAGNAKPSIDWKVSKRTSSCGLFWRYLARIISCRGKKLPEHPLCCQEVGFLTRLRRRFVSWVEERCCQWSCCPCFRVFQHFVGLFILDAFVELFSTLCIVFNTILMALDQPDKSEQMSHFLRIANYFFTITFSLEALLKLIAMGPKIYFADSWNRFDFIVVLFSLIEIPLANIGLSILRAFRLLRVFKLAKSWQTMKLLFSIVARTMNSLGNLTVVLMISIFVFAVLGMSLFGESYQQFRNVTRFPDRGGCVPRWNFSDFTHSFMIVFRVLCGEWIESMWDCLEVNGWTCILFFLLTMVLGNLVVLSLFLALLLSSFSAESFQRGEEVPEEPNKLQEALDRIYRAGVWLGIKMRTCSSALSRHIHNRQSRRLGVEVFAKNVNMIAGRTIDNTQHQSRPNITSEIEEVLNINLYDKIQIANVAKSRSCDDSPGHCSIVKINGDHPQSLLNTYNSSEESSVFLPTATSSIGHPERKSNLAHSFVEETAQPPEEILEALSVEIKYWRHPEDCCAAIVWRQFQPLCKPLLKTKVGPAWRKFRQCCYCIVENRYFEGFIFFMIIISSGTLALEDRNLPSRPMLKMILDYMDKACTLIFLIEILLKWFAYGLHKFFRDAWCWLDFSIVGIAIVSMVMSYTSVGGKSNMNSLKAMRTLRALRPLRALSRWEGMKIVVNALLQAIPSICNVVVVCLVFWLICSIMGMQLFGGKFRKCVDEATGLRLPAELYPNRTICQLHHDLYGNVSWENSKINFDNVLNGFLALLQVATFKGWIEIMADAVDIVDFDQQPVYNNATGYYLFFVLFIIIGSFFTLNLFIGVIIQNFNVQKKKVGGSLELFMTEDQKKYYHAMKKMVRKAPQKPIPKPKLRISKLAFRIISNQKFDLFIMAMIGFNTLIMCFEHHQQSEAMKEVMEIINKIFLIIFTGEFVLKLIGQRWYYFKDGWNIFDCSIVIFSLICWGLEDLMMNLPVPPTTIRIVRLFRVGRVLRLVKSARGIRTLLFALIVSVPALFNIALLLFLTAFIYAIVGMSFFGRVAYFAGIDSEFNFETFPQAFIILLQISTSGGWSTVFEGLSNTDPAYCSPEEGTCGSFILAVAFLVSYLVMSFMVIINMYIAVILENFSQANEDVQQGLTQDEFDEFYEVWELYDVRARGFIRIDVLEEFVDRIGPPLGIPRPNRIKLACLAIPICSKNRIFCMDLLDALTRNFLGHLTDNPEALVANIEQYSTTNAASSSKIGRRTDKNGDQPENGGLDFTKVAKEPIVVISNTYSRLRERQAAYRIVYFLRKHAAQRLTAKTENDVA